MNAMRMIVYPRLMGPLGKLFILLFYCALFLSAAWRVEAGVAFKVKISGANYQPHITIQNETPTLITNIVVQIGDTAQHFESTTITPADSTTVTDGIATDPGSDSIRVACTNFGFTKELILSTTLDSDTLQGMHCYVNWVWYFYHDGHFFVWVPEPGSALDWRYVLLGGYIKVQAVGGQEETIHIGNPSGVYLSATRPVVINLRSISEVQAATNNDEEIVKQVTVKVNGFMMETKMGEGAFSVIDGCTVEILAPPIAYKDILGNDITDLATDPAGNANDVIKNFAEHRFTAIGLSVNDVPQTGDPTYYKFTYKSSAPVTDVIVKWRHEYALTMAQDFRFTACVLTNQDGNPWAGPLTSTAEGNPVPEAKKHWIGRGAQVVAAVDGAVVDLNHPGLDVRYVCRSYSSYGPPNNNSSPSLDAQAIIQNAGGSNVVAEKILTNSVGTFGSIGSRQQVKAFTMNRPGGIKYIWQIQYGVKINVDDLSRADAPKVFTGAADSMPTVAGDGEGTFWFDPGTRVVVASLATASNKALKSWINGDGFYFSSQGQIDDSHGGVLTQGGPAPAASAQWRTNFTLNGKMYRGLEIPQIQRPVRVMWMYGPPAIAVNVPIGEYVFQHDPTNGNFFTTKPDQINQLAVDGLNKMVGDNDMSVWDPTAARLYPLIPGRFKASWRPNPASSNVVEVYVSAFWPGKAHYPHIAGTPAVSVDPDPSDSFVFKEVKYTENSAVVDSSKRFSVAQPGRTVLLFGELQQAGRGALREYLRVRVVETKSYKDGLREGPAIIGQKITDPELDQANLGTGYVMPSTNGSPVRYNAFIYDSSKLEGIAAKDIYDMARLRSDKAEKVVINKQLLPGPIIPVNLHPGAKTEERINVVWYADPATHDGLLWPYVAKTYIPRWPTTASEGLGRIVIASQYGSESVGSNGADQVIMPETTNLITDASGHRGRYECDSGRDDSEPVPFPTSGYL